MLPSTLDKKIDSQGRYLTTINKMIWQDMSTACPCFFSAWVLEFYLPSPTQLEGVKHCCSPLHPRFRCEFLEQLPHVFVSCYSSIWARGFDRNSESCRFESTRSIYNSCRFDVRRSRLGPRLITKMCLPLVCRRETRLHIAVPERARAYPRIKMQHKLSNPCLWLIRCYSLEEFENYASETFYSFICCYSSVVNCAFVQRLQWQVWTFLFFHRSIENTSWKVLACGIYALVVFVSEIARVSAANE